MKTIDGMKNVTFFFKKLILNPLKNPKVTINTGKDAKKLILSKGFSHKLHKVLKYLNVTPLCFYKTVAVENTRSW